MNNKFDKLARNAKDNKAIYEMALMVENAQTNIKQSCFIGKLGRQEIDQHTSYFLASATKLFVTTLIMQLLEKKQLSLQTPIVEFFALNHLKGLHIYKGVEHTNNITIENLLAHTSGLADYFEQKQQNGSVFAKDILAGKDRAFNVDGVIEIVSNMKPAFIPSTPNKAFYSDTNYQLLGAIIEKVTGKSFAKAVEQNITIPLGLKNTFVFEKNNKNASRKIIPLRFGNAQLEIPKAMTSVGADGAIVSSAYDGLIFIKAFFNGELFSKDLLIPMMTKWRKIFFPLQYGTGIMLFRMPAFMSLFQKQPNIVGHSGISGAFLFAEPENNIYISGTINQLASRSLPYNIMLRAMASLRE